MPDTPPTAEETVRAYFTALTDGEMVSIRTYVSEDFDVRIQPRRVTEAPSAFQDALEKYMHLTEDTEGFQITHEALSATEADSTAWFEGKQAWVVEWDGKVTRMRVDVSGVLEHDGISWKLEHVHLAPGDV